MTASAATILCMKAKSIKIARGSMMLIHNSSQMLDVWTSANKEKIDQIIQQFQHEREQLDTIDKCMADLYSLRNKKSLEENLEMMAKEKWLSAKEALDFGLVDGIIDDDEQLATAAKSVKSHMASYAGAAEHYGVPAFEGEKAPSHSFMQRMKDALSRMSSIMADGQQQEEPLLPTNSITTMKKIVLNLVCAVLALQDIELNEETGVAGLTEEQLNKIENDMKEKADKIALLEQQLAEANTAKQEAVDAKTTAEQQLADLQNEFDEYKAAAGDDTLLKPANEPGKTNNVSSAEMFNQIKDIL